MKLLLLLSFVALVLGNEAYIGEKITETNDAPQQATVDLQAQSNVEDTAGDKKVNKRSYGWGPWNYGYSYGWPWYGGLGGHGWYGGWYPGWPWWYGGYGGHGRYGGYSGYGGYRGWSGHGGGWYKGW